MEGNTKDSHVIVEGSMEWVDQLIDKLLMSNFKPKHYFFPPKKGKKKKFIRKELNIKKLKHKFNHSIKVKA